MSLKEREDLVGQEEPERFFHGVLGTPDEENCPICRAHPPGEINLRAVQDDAQPGEGSIVIQELSLSEILSCPCPMCVQARQGEIG